MMFTACKVLKKGYILLETDFQSHVFGYLITRVWICSLPGIKGHPCDPNEATQLVNFLMHINEFEKFCFLPILRRELHLIAEQWNTHNIQKQKRFEVEGGKPDVMLFLPEAYGTHNYLLNVDMEDVNACQEMYSENAIDYNEDLEELVTLIKPDYEQP